MIKLPYNYILWYNHTGHGYQVAAGKRKHQHNDNILIIMSKNYGQRVSGMCITEHYKGDKNEYPDHRKQHEPFRGYILKKN